MTVLDEPVTELPATLYETRGPAPRPAGMRVQPVAPAGDGRARGLRPPLRPKKRSQCIPTVLIDKSALFRAGLAHILAGDRFRVTATCVSPREVPDSALGQGRCLVLIGCDNDELGDILPEITRLKQDGEHCRAIVLTEQFHPEEWLAAVAAGADGYLLKSEITPEALVQSLALVWLGGVVAPQGLGRMLKGRHEPLEEPASDGVGEETPAERAPSMAPNGDLARLSNREQMILVQLTQGASNKHIARELNIAEATVKVHVKSLLRKIRVNNRTQAAMWAIERIRKTPG